METWKAFEANELTHSAAHHLLAIHDVGLAYGGWARVSDIARRLDITRGSVSVNLRPLKKRGWIETDEHHMVKLLRARAESGAGGHGQAGGGASLPVRGAGYAGAAG